MADPRETQYLKLVQDFPDSPMGHLSLGKLYLEQRRYQEAVACLEKATALEPGYAAALVALGDAYAGLRQTEKARQTFGRAREVAVAQSHPGLAEEIDERLADL